MTVFPEKSDPSAEPPVLTKVVDSAAIIPTLTRVAATPAAAAPGKSASASKAKPNSYSASDVQHLLDALTPHLEATLKAQLAVHLDILAKHAVAHTIEELKKDPSSLLHAIKDNRT